MSRDPIKAKLVGKTVVSTTVGTWLSRCADGDSLQEGQVIGVLRQATRWTQVLAPHVGSGKVARVKLGHVSVQYGTPLFEISESSDIDVEKSETGLPSGVVEILAPMAGTIYFQPSPSEPVFASAGDLVAKNDTVALMEVMKSLTPVRVNRAGKIEMWLVENGAPVDAGQAIGWMR